MSQVLSRRDLLSLSGGAAAAAALANEARADAAPPAKSFRIGVISAAKQPRNGHTWYFAQYLHPVCDMDALKRNWAQSYPSFAKYYRNPARHFDLLPFPDTRIAQYYDADPKGAAAFCECFPGVKPAESVEKMVQEVDAIFLGDASGTGDDHFDLAAPGLAKGLPTFCDKPIGGTPEGTKKILDFAKKHGTPIMSSSGWRYERGMEAALRMRDSGDFGELEHVSARLFSRYGLRGWMIYGQHPVWAVLTLMGAGVDAVSMYEYKDTAHALITYPDRYPGHCWYGQPYERFEYDRTDVYFKKKLHSWTPSIDTDFVLGHHYWMLHLADAFRKMVQSRKEPIPHREILEVTAIVHACAKSLQEKSRLVKLTEVLPDGL